MSNQGLTGNKLLDQPVSSLLLTMSLPMMLSMVVQSLYNIVDRMFVARLGVEALTAVSYVFPLQNLVLSLSLIHICIMRKIRMYTLAAVAAAVQQW